MFMIGIVLLGALFSGTYSSHVDQPSKHELDTISNLVTLVRKGEYPVRKGRRLHWNQRMAILRYKKKTMGDPVIWTTLALGSVSTARKLVSNKKLWLDVWEKENPEKFPQMERYLPKSWSDTSSFMEEMKEDSIYVYKPVLGCQGRGISFKTGADMSRQLSEQGNEGDMSEWVIQEFVESFLYNNKKTHMRVVSLAIVQPDGSREFYVYHRMRLFTAPEDYDRNRLTNGDDVYFMLVTNGAQNEEYFYLNPENEGKTFSSSNSLFDAETALGKGDADLSFDYVFEESKEMHKTIYSVIGNMIECKATDVSVYDDACFHIFASDIAFDNNGDPVLLEMNHRMGYDIWTREEQAEFTGGSASLVKGTMSPYSPGNTSMWKKIDV